MRELLENPLRNAVEHGGPDVPVRVEALDAGFAVEDGGPGIPEDERGEVFDPGYTATDEGVEFGLYIVETTVDAHGWEIATAEGADGGVREITGVDPA